MDINDKPVKSCAIKVHLANLINRKSHVTLVVPELCSGLTIKTTTVKKIGMNDQHIKATSLFVCARDSFKSVSNLEENNGSNFFHVQDADMPGQYVNLRFCEFHLYWRESLPSMLEKSVNISEFRSRTSAEEKFVSVANSKPVAGQGQANGSLKTGNFSKVVPTNNFLQMTFQNQSKSNLSEKIDKKPVARGNSFNLMKKASDKNEPIINKEANSVRYDNLTSEIKRRPSLASVRAKMKGLNSQNKQAIANEEPKVVQRKHEVGNSPCSSYSSSSIEMKHNLSSSMPVLNKLKLKDFQNILNKKNLPPGKRSTSKASVSDNQCDSMTSERLSASRRQLPQVSISEEDVEEKRHLLSKQLEKRLIRRATVNESSGGAKKPLHKTQSLLSWKEKFKSCNEDSDDSRSLASQEVAEIMADAGPMGVIESDYEDPGSSSRDDEQERSDPCRKNVFLSLFDSMTIDLINESSDLVQKISRESPRSEMDGKSHLTKPGSFSKHLPPKAEFQSTKSSFTLYSTCKENKISSESQAKLTLFDLLKPGVLKLFPISVHLTEKRTKAYHPMKVLPFKVQRDVIKLSPSRNDIGAKIDEMTKSFEALKIRNLDNDDNLLHHALQKNKDREHSFRPGDLLIEVNDVNVLGFTELQFSELEASILSKCDTIRMVVARPSKNL